MVVKFDVESEYTIAFNTVYDQQFLRPLFDMSPQLRSINRFQTYSLEKQCNQGNPYWTFYELDCEDTLSRTDEIFSKPEFSGQLAQFRQYKDLALHNFTRVNYEPIHNFIRRTESIGLCVPFATFRRLERFDILPQRRDEFLEWYLGQYQEEIQECTPAYSAYQIFQACGETPGTLMSVFHADFAEEIDQSLELLRGKKLGVHHPKWLSYCNYGTVQNFESTALSLFLTLP